MNNLCPFYGDSKEKLNDQLLAKKYLKLIAFENK